VAGEMQFAGLRDQGPAGRTAPYGTTSWYRNGGERFLPNK